MMNSEDTRSLGSIVFSYGYSEVYDNYLSQFKNKTINSLLRRTYDSIKNEMKNIENSSFNQ